MFVNGNLSHFDLIVEKQYFNKHLVGRISMRNLGICVTFAEPYLIFMISDRLENNISMSVSI